jgi:hypothetical protein
LHLPLFALMFQDLPFFQYAVVKESETCDDEKNMLTEPAKARDWVAQDRPMQSSSAAVVSPFV